MTETTAHTVQWIAYYALWAVFWHGLFTFLSTTIIADTERKRRT